ncbi:MAG: hypothetical protein ACRCSK_07470, partial [Fusobacteriaceae bacterium]
MKISLKFSWNKFLMGSLFFFIISTTIFSEENEQKKSSDEAKLPNIVLGLGAGSGIYENSSGIPNRIYELESEPNAAS